MKPTSEQVAEWHDDWATPLRQEVPLSKYIAQRAAEWAFEEAAKIAQSFDDGSGDLQRGSDGWYIAEAIRNEIEK